MSKPILLGVGGAAVGVVVAFAAFTLLLGGGAESVSAAPPTSPVNTTGKLGPHLTLQDRVFNLLPDSASDRTYLKLQTVIEFESYDERWADVLAGCGTDSRGHRVPPAGGSFGGAALMVSAVPAPARPASADAAAAGAEESDPCEAKRADLMSEFEHQIGTGLQLIEDTVTTVVTGHTASEIVTPEGKAALKQEIQRAVDELIREPRVHRVLFLNFITQ